MKAIYEALDFLLSEVAGRPWRMGNDGRLTEVKQLRAALKKEEEQPVRMMAAQVEADRKAQTIKAVRDPIDLLENLRKSLEEKV